MKKHWNKIWPKLWKSVTTYLALWAIVRETPLELTYSIFWFSLAILTATVFYWYVVGEITNFFKSMNEDIKYIKRKVKKIK